MFEISAVVISGRGMASDRRKQEIDELSRITCKTFMDGSLNLVAGSPLWLNPDKVVYKSKSGHRYWTASLEGVPVVLNRWRGDCPAHIYEVYAGVMLRDELNLQDNDRVRLCIDEGIVDLRTSGSVKHKLAWYLFWFCREKLYYTSDWYTRVIRRKPLLGYIWRASQS